MRTKQGGNGDVVIKNGIATKTLRTKSVREKIARFKREIEVLKKIQNEERFDNVVSIIDVGVDDVPPWYSMKAYDGDVNDILSSTRENISATVNLLAPIITTLKVLSELEEPIYHRDLKPDNLLYELSDGRPRLVLADFGCAWLNTDEDQRLTQEFRAVGAMAYRAPECHYGRVDHVNEKGDIFSLGKILWHLINGISDEVFPYTLWFPPEYNLAQRFPQLPGIDRVNLLVASAVHHDAQKRIDYTGFLAALQSLAQNDGANPEAITSVKMLQYEANLSLQLEEKYAVSESLVRTLMDDFHQALKRLSSQNPDSETLKQLLSTFKLLFPIQTILAKVIHEDSDFLLWNRSMPNIRINSRIYPGHAKILPLVSSDFPWAQISCVVTNSNGNKLNQSMTYFYDTSLGMQIIINGAGTPEMHNSNMAYEVLIKAITHLST